MVLRDLVFGISYRKNSVLRYEFSWNGTFLEGEKSERKAHSVSLARQMWRVRPFLLNCRARPPPAAPPLLPLAPTTSSAPPPPTVPAISSTLSSLAVVFVYAAIPTTPQRYSPLRSPVFVLHLPSFLGLSFHVPVACPGRMRARAHTSTNSFEQKDRERRGKKVDKWSRIRHGSSSPQNTAESLETRSLQRRLRIRHRDAVLFLRARFRGPCFRPSSWNWSLRYS